MISEERCGLISLTQEKLKNIFDQLPSIDEVVLYGLRAKGNFKPGSDIDQTIKSQQMSLSELFKIENQIDDLFLPYKIDFSLFSSNRQPQLS